MSTIPTIADDHFDGGANLSPGTRRSSDDTLPDIIQAAKTDLVAVEARATILETFQAALESKQACRLCTAGALDAYTPAGAKTTKALIANAVGALTIDGVAAALGDRVLVNNDGTATPADRGVYVVTVIGDGTHAWQMARAIDCNTNAEVTSGLYVRITEGTANGDTGWVLTTNDPIDLDVTGLSFSAWGKYGAGGDIADVTKAAASAGTSALVARADHKHNISTAAVGDALAAAAAEGSATSLARSDHVHSLGSAVIKRGRHTFAAPGDFDVAFAVAYGDTDYSIGFASTVVAAVPIYANKAAGGFRITVAAACDVEWTTVHD